MVKSRLIMAKIRTRFAPSPTGFLHIGSLRTALYAYALAKYGGGDFILRIEDTDLKRQLAGASEALQDTLKKFGLEWDEYYVQSERLDLYRKAAERLVKDGNAYKDEGAIRIKIPKNEKVSFHDFVLDKDISWDTNTLKDLVLLKSNGFPTYHLAVVVDDHDMEISHVLRGHDWLPSTPLHILLYKFLDYKMPEIGHLTDILDPEGGKLSKRKGSTSCEGLINEGYLPEAILNFVMLLGWAPKDNRELFSLDGFVKAFDPAGFQKSNPIFNKEKLDWFNAEYIRKLSDESLNSKFKIQNSKFGELPEGKQLSITKLVKDRIKKISDFDGLAGFFLERPEVDKNLFGPKHNEHLNVAVDALKAMKQWDNETINEQLLKAVNNNSFETGDFFMDLRIAITGSKITPPINESIEILGKEETVKRIRSAIVN
jgi:glutamyl-tRNA synthetase